MACEAGPALDEDQAGAAALSPEDRQYSAGAAWINGVVVPIGDAHIPILDVGFVRSDLTYDVVAVWDGSFFRLGDHLDRFRRNQNRLRLDTGMEDDDIASILGSLVARTGLRDAYVAMIATRGVPGPGERDPRNFVNRFYAYVIPYVWIVRPDQQEAGIDLVIAKEVHRVSPQAFDPTVKSFQWGDLTRGLFEAYDRGAFTAVLTDADGNVTEGPGFNLFAMIDGVLCTPDVGMFDGITRRTILEQAERSHIRTRVAALRMDDLHAASEIFMTSTAGGVMPVRSLDGDPTGGGRPGPVTQGLRDAYWALHKDSRYATAVDYSAR